MIITETQLRRIIRSVINETYIEKQRKNTNGIGVISDYESKQWKIVFPKRNSPVYGAWKTWFENLKKDYVINVKTASSHDENRRGWHDIPPSQLIDAVVIVYRSVDWQFDSPPKDPEGFAEITLQKINY